MQKLAILILLAAVAGLTTGVQLPLTTQAGQTGKIYWTDVIEGKIQRSNLDGSAVEDLVSGLSGPGIGPTGIALDVSGGKMYWAEVGPGGQGKIRRAGLDGDTVEDVVSGLDIPTGIALDASSGKMYWTNFEPGTIQRANQNGSGVEELLTGLGGPAFIALDLQSGKMYWTEYSAGRIQRANLDGSGAESLLTGHDYVGGIALDTDSEKMYWTDLEAGTVHRANLDGSAEEDLVEGISDLYAIALDVSAGKMYWADAGADKIRRANLDGSDIEDLLTGVNFPVGIALDLGSPPPPPPPPPPPVVVLVHGWGGSCDTFATLEPWLENRLGLPDERVICFDPPEDGRNNGYRYQSGTWVNGLYLSTFVQELLSELAPIRDGKVDIVAHSFGGLVSRFYIEGLGGASNVRSLTMLGTPNLGTRWADVASRVFRSDYALRDMRLASNEPGGLLHILNNGFTMPSGTAYRAVAGIWSAPAWFWLGRPNDCVVPESSVRGPFPEVAVSRNVSHPGPCNAAPAFLTDDLPPSNCISEPAYVFCDVLQVLTSPGGGSAAGTSSYAASAAGDPNSGLSGAGLLHGLVEPGGTDSYSIEVDGSVKELALTLSWPGASDRVRLEVENPEGNVVQPSDANVTYDPPGEMMPGFVVETYHLAAPSAGTWVLRVEALSVDPNGQEYVLAGFYDSPITVETALGGALVLVGETTEVTVRLETSDGPITGAAVTAVVADPSGSLQVLALTDDGIMPDLGADDGVYTAALEIDSCGIYLVDVLASGTASKASFERGDFASVEGHVSGHVIGDPCVDDYDHDGCTDGQEVGLSAALGGQRDPNNFWDFYDTPAGTPPERDQKVNIIDIAAIVLRFGTVSDPPPTKQDALAEALSPPPDLTSYHAAFDRDSPIPGDNLWDLQPPDGAINILEISAAVIQFGHTCA